MPKLTLIYDVKSVSAAAVAEFTYRFSDVFSMSFGVAFFMGREFLTDMNVNPLAYGKPVQLGRVRWGPLQKLDHPGCRDRA